MNMNAQDIFKLTDIY